VSGPWGPKELVPAGVAEGASLLQVALVRRHASSRLLVESATSLSSLFLIARMVRSCAREAWVAVEDEAAELAGEVADRVVFEVLGPLPEAAPVG